MSSPIIVLHYSGPLIASTVDRFERQITTHYKAGQNRVILNLADVTLLDSLGLGFLIEQHRHCQAQGGQLVLCQISEPVQMVLALTATQQMLTHFQTEQAAQDYVQAQIRELDPN